MMKGGGGILGTVFTAISFIPGMQWAKPIALAINTINAIDSGNPLALASSAMGWHGYTNGFTNFTDPFTRDMSSLGNMFDSSPAYMSGNLSDIAAYDNAMFGAGAGDITTGATALGGDWVSNAGWSGFANPIDTAMSASRTMGTDEFADYLGGTKGYKDFASQIQSGVEGAQEAARGAVDFSKQAGIAAGSQDVALNTLQDLYTVPGYNYDISALTPQLDINTLGGYEGANQLLSEGPMSLQNMQQFGSTGQGISDMAGSGTQAALGVDQVQAMNPNTEAFGTYGVDNTFDDGSMFKTMNQPQQPSVDLSGSTGSGLDATNSTGGLSLDPNKSGIGLTKPDGYTWSEKGMFGQPTGAGINADVTQTPVAQAGNQFGNTGWEFNQPKSFGEKSMGFLDNLTKRGTMENRLLQGGMAGMDYLQGRRAEKNLNAMYERAMAGADPQAGNRAFASGKWQEAVSNPEVLWDRYMQGQGGQDLANMAAKYAKAGRRNMLPQLTSQARQQFMANYVPEYMKATNPSVFGSGNAASVAKEFGPSLYNAERNRYAPLTKGLQSIFGSPNYQS